ncbi:hypothetical protein WG906_04280 [Pedobacter sp. P351]|uniref:hypothetical protein n=1 Tax=Pedobacter superstes TaxID=3133441 RepID=UPI0030AB440A
MRVLTNPRSAWSPDLFPASKLVWQRGKSVYAKIPHPNIQPSGMQRQTNKPSPGDVFGIFFASKGRIAHCGFVDSWNDSWLLTVEGNTNEAGSREGDGVYKKRRLKSTVHMVANWVGDL